MAMTERENRQFPTVAGVFFGVGLGGFFDGIVLHQVLQWHHMVTSAGYPADTLENLKLNTLIDGLFHATTETVPRDQWIYWDIGFLIWGAVMLIGGWLLWKAGQRETPD